MDMTRENFNNWYSMVQGLSDITERAQWTGSDLDDFGSELASNPSKGRVLNRDNFAG